MVESGAFATAFIGGLVPSLIWLGFWLFEDRCEPEPKIRILLTFLAGMAAVPIALYLERWVMPYASGVALLAVWAVVEETLKFAAAAAFGLSSPAYDEPVDAIIYLSTAALGFAAAENALFLFGWLENGSVLQSVAQSDMRFIGATLLHILSSATVGLSIAYAFYRSRIVRYDATFIGLVLAIFLHTLFNFFILQLNGNDMIFAVFLALWAGIVAVLFFTERIKEPARDYCV